jgi:predicted Zn-dependent protease
VDDRYIVFEGSRDNRPFKLMVPDKSILNALQAIGAPRQFLDALQQTISKQGRRSMGRGALLAGILTICLVLILIVWLGFGHAVKKAVDMIPLEWEVALGQSAAKGLLEDTKTCSDPALTAVMNEMGTRLVGELERVPFDFKIRVLDTDDVNAFALPGGYLFVNRGLIEQADDGFEVAGVLAHEIQHAMLRHGIHNVVREAGMMLMLQVVIGDVGGIEQFLLYNAASLSSMSFSREQETAADIEGLALMYRAGMDPTGLPRFLKKLAAKEGIASNALSILSTHPASRDRVEELNDIIRAKGNVDITPLTRNFNELKGRCSPVSLTDPDTPI